MAPWTERLILPVFALFNAGIVLSVDAVAGDAAGSAVTARRGPRPGRGQAAGRRRCGVAGRAAGWVHLPPDVTTRHLGVLAAVAGIGFTVSLFIAGLAFDDPAPAADATIGVLAGSLVAALVAAVALRRVRTSS